MRFFEERFEPVLQLDAIAGELIAATHHRSPKPLFRAGHETERRFLRDQTLHQTFGIRKVLLPPADAAIRLRLREIEVRGRALARAAAWLPTSLQRLPDGPPVLRG